jgi:jasmonoyl-L-amino acid hydrolase
MVMNIFSLLM